MRAFTCPTCGQLVFFENVACLRCGTALGFCPVRLDIVAVSHGDAGGTRRCANQVPAGCNWLVTSSSGTPRTPGAEAAMLCASCRLTRTRPNDADLGGGPTAAAFATAEAAKRRLVFQLLELGLPIGSQRDRPDEGPVFDFLSSTGQCVNTGHLDGVITIDLAESDDAHRERMRQELGEPYRTMLGHLRHEAGHYYWSLLVAGEAAISRYRALFGDEQADYGEALQRHYDQGVAARWDDRHVSAYAAAHPWEDWAETFAHYLHIRDTLQTAAAFGLRVTGPRLDPALMAAPSLEPDGQFDDILGDWLPLTYALNAINRSMGKDDLYPFVLSPSVVQKLAFVHELFPPAVARPAHTGG